MRVMTQRWTPRFGDARKINIRLCAVNAIHFCSLGIVTTPVVQAHHSLAFLDLDNPEHFFRRRILRRILHLGSGISSPCVNAELT